jgi:hypothetical protein
LLFITINVGFLCLESTDRGFSPKEEELEVFCEIHNDLILELVQTEIALIDECSKKSLEDFILGKFDDECLGDNPPESDWNDWFPPPPRMTEEELDVLGECSR